MSVYYTGKGDNGESHVGRKKYPKTGIEFTALGDLDELNSLLGIIKNLTRGEASVILEQIQQDLFIIQAYVGTFWFEKKYKPPNFSCKKVHALEAHIARFEKNLLVGGPLLKKFIIPGTNELSAWIDYARAVSRRVERSVVSYHAQHPLDPAILSYCNRLSSLLFALARAAALQSNISESHPHYDRD